MGRIVKFLFGTLAFIIGLFAVGIGYLKANDVFRQQLFAKLLNHASDVNDTATMNLRCNEVLRHSDVKGRVLEIGSGTGINFACLHNNTNIESYIGIEPNVHMRQYFDQFVKQYDIPYEVQLLDISAADMNNIESNSIDTIIMTLVLCSIPDPLPDRVLREAYRVLKPGGSFIFFEHVSANPEIDPFMHQFQRVIEPVWAVIADGCQFKPIVNYFDAVRDIYSKVDYERAEFPAMKIVREAIKGRLIK